MTVSLNKGTDDEILELARVARNDGATVKLITTELNKDGFISSVRRKIVITYDTHSTEAKTL